MLVWLSKKECKEEYLFAEVSGRENWEGTLSSQQLTGQRLGTVFESLIKDSPCQLLGMLSIRIYLCERKKGLGEDIQEY